MLRLDYRSTFLLLNFSMLSEDNQLSTNMTNSMVARIQAKLTNSVINGRTNFWDTLKFK